MYPYIPPPPPPSVVSYVVSHVNDGMHASQKVIHFIVSREGCYLRPYRDIGGLRTVGIGHLITSDEEFPDDEEITEDTARRLLLEEIRFVEKMLKKNVKVKLNQDQFDALVSFGFNCGVGVFKRSGVMSAVNSGDFKRVPDRLLEWSKANVGGVLRTVDRIADRRRREGDMFTGRMLTRDPRTWVMTNLSRSIEFMRRAFLIPIPKNPAEPTIFLNRSCQR